MSEQRITQHRSTCPPFECNHCGYCWYGTAWNSSVPESTVLCTKCNAVLNEYLHTKHNDLYWDKDQSKLHPIALEWINDPTKKPLRKAENRRFHKSVPAWMRRAILANAVQPNGELMYTVFSQGSDFVKAEAMTVEESRERKLQQVIAKGYIRKTEVQG